MAGEPEDPEHFTTGDLARLTGNTLRTVRYYEEVGLLSPAARSEGRHRLFTRADLDRLRTVTDLRAVGLSLEEVARVLRVRLRRPEGTEPLQHAAAIIDDQLAQIRERIATLTRVEQDLVQARRLLEQCDGCAEVDGRGRCEHCSAMDVADTNVLVSIMLK